jgi:hypothetical protein
MLDDLPIENVPAIMLSFDHQVSDGRIIRFSTGIAQAARPEELNALLDKLTAAADRQEAKYRLERLANDLKREEKLYEQGTADMLRLDEEARASYQQSGRRADWSPDKLTGAQRKDRENAEVSMSRRRDMIVALREQVALARGIVDGAHGATNSH